MPGSCNRDAATAGSVTLLEGPSWAREMSELKDRFCVCSFHGIFRKDKHLRSNKRTLFTPESLPHKHPRPTKEEPYPNEGLGWSQTLITPSERREQYNVPKLPQEIIEALKAKKVCTRLYLLGRCNYVDFGEYKYDHHAQHNEDGLIAPGT